MIKSTTTRLRLSAATLGDDTTEEQAADWVTYVGDRIGAITGLEIAVDDSLSSFDQDEILFGTSDEWDTYQERAMDEEQIRDAVQGLWAAWC